MPRIAPLANNEIQPVIKAAFTSHLLQYNGGINNMKATLYHSPLAFDIYMQWYPLYEEVQKITGPRLAYLYAYSISLASESPLWSAFFRKLIADGGEDPDHLHLSVQDRCLVDLGSSMARYRGNIADHIYDCTARQYSQEQMVVLIAFAGQMIATNVFNNVIETTIDDSLVGYIPCLHLTQ